MKLIYINIIHGLRNEEMKQEEEWRNETRGKQVKILSAKPGMKQLVYDDWNCKWQIVMVKLEEMKQSKTRYAIKTKMIIKSQSFLRLLISFIGKENHLIIRTCNL